MISQDEINAIKEITKLQKEETQSILSAKMPMVLQKISGGLTFKEMKAFKDKGIVELKEKVNEKGEKTLLSNEEAIFEVVVPLLEMRGVDAETLNDVEGADYLTYYRKVEALTNNPKLQEEVEKKN